MNVQQNPSDRPQNAPSPESPEIPETSEHHAAQDSRKALRRTVGKVLFVYLFASLLTGRGGIFAGLCAGLPFAMPAVLCPTRTGVSAQLRQGLLWGVPGIAAAVIFLLLTGDYSTAAWLIPASVGAAGTVLYALLCRELPERQQRTAQSAALLAVMLVSFF